MFPQWKLRKGIVEPIGMREDLVSVSAEMDPSFEFVAAGDAGRGRLEVVLPACHGDHYMRALEIKE
jgi:hypothetical protein